MIDAPCKGCEKRNVGCHDTCAGYKVYKEFVRRYRHEAFIDSIPKRYSKQKDSTIKARKAIYSKKKKYS